MSDSSALIFFPSPSELIIMPRKRDTREESNGINMEKLIEKKNKQ